MTSDSQRTSFYSLSGSRAAQLQPQDWVRKDCDFLSASVHWVPSRGCVDQSLMTVMIHGQVLKDINPNGRERVRALPNEAGMRLQQADAPQ